MFFGEICGLPSQEGSGLKHFPDLLLRPRIRLPSQEGSGLKLTRRSLWPGGSDVFPRKREVDWSLNFYDLFFRKLVFPRKREVDWSKFMSTILANPISLPSQEGSGLKHRDRLPKFRNGAVFPRKREVDWSNKDMTCCPGTKRLPSQEGSGLKQKLLWE